MRFMSLVKSKESKMSPPPKPLMEAIDKLVQEAAKEGCVMVQAGGLFPTQAGARVRLDGGKLTVTDGPFTEAKEVIGGYWLIQARSKEEAVQWASRCPANDGDVIEVRQVFELSDFDDTA
jgi:hypothetical protein